MKQYVSLTDKMTIWEAVKWGEEFLKKHNRPDAAIDARLLMEYVLDCSSSRLLLCRQEPLQEEAKAQFQMFIEKRGSGIPLQHLTHEQEFMGLDFYVDENVLIPRQDTETLVEKILEHCKTHVVRTGLDIGTGSGCIGISLCHYLTELKMTLVDISQEALNIARRNVQLHQLQQRITLLGSDLLTSYKGEKVDLIVSNPPYIPAADMEELMTEVKDHEPHLALTDGKDGLSFYQKLTRLAPAYLNEGGLLAYEIGYDEGPAVVRLLEDEGYKEVRLYQDLAGNDRVVTGIYMR